MSISAPGVSKVEAINFYAAVERATHSAMEFLRYEEEWLVSGLSVDQQARVCDAVRDALTTSLAALVWRRIEER